MPHETLDELICEIASKHGPGCYLSDPLVRVYKARLIAALVAESYAEQEEEK